MALPFVVLVMLALAQLAVVVRNELAVELAAREGARAASVAADAAGAATAAARRAADLPIEVTTTVSDGAVTVVVTYVDPTDVAVIGAFVGSVTHTAAVTMALEPP